MWGPTRGHPVDEAAATCVPYAKWNPRNRAFTGIANGRPAVIGIGFLEHYPLAWGYSSREDAGYFVTATQGYFYVNQGWRRDPCKGDWVAEESVWFGNDTTVR